MLSTSCKLARRNQFILLQFTSIYYLSDEDELAGKMSRGSYASPYQVQMSTIFQHCPRIFEKKIKRKNRGNDEDPFLVIKFDFGRRNVPDLHSIFVQNISDLC